MIWLCNSIPSHSKENASFLFKKYCCLLAKRVDLEILELIPLCLRPLCLSWSISWCFEKRKLEFPCLFWWGMKERRKKLDEALVFSPFPIFIRILYSVFPSAGCWMKTNLLIWLTKNKKYGIRNYIRIYLFMYLFTHVILFVSEDCYDFICLNLGYFSYLVFSAQ